LLVSDVSVLFAGAASSPRFVVVSIPPAVPVTIVFLLPATADVTAVQ
jgi:hypothetical protein